MFRLTKEEMINMNLSREDVRNALEGTFGLPIYMALEDYIYDNNVLVGFNVGSKPFSTLKLWYTRGVAWYIQIDASQDLFDVTITKRTIIKDDKDYFTVKDYFQTTSTYLKEDEALHSVLTFLRTHL